MRGRVREVVLACVLAVVMVMALSGVPVRASEATLSGAYQKPDDGHAAWNATGEVLFGSKRFVAGPSVTYYDAVDLEGGGAGGAAEVQIVGPFWMGGAVHYLLGDARDVADYTAQARAIVKVGTGRVFAKVYVGRTWVRGLDGEVEDPTGTEGWAGFGARW